MAGLACLYVKTGQEAEAIPIAHRVFLNLLQTRGEADLLTRAAMVGFVYLHVRNDSVHAIIGNAEAYVSALIEDKGEANMTANAARVGLAYLYAKDGQPEAAIEATDNVCARLDGWLSTNMEKLSLDAVAFTPFMPLMLSYVYLEAGDPSKILKLANVTAETFRREERPNGFATLAAAFLVTQLNDAGYDDSAHELAQLVTARYDEIDLPMTGLNFTLVSHLADLYDLAGRPDTAATIRKRNRGRFIEGMHVEGTWGSFLTKIISGEL